MENVVNRYRISIDTLTRAKDFSNAIQGEEKHIRLVGGEHGECEVKGESFLRSILSTLHALSFKNLWIESDKEIYSKIKDFVINDSKNI